MYLFKSCKFFLLAILFLSTSYGADWPGKKSDWKGFTRYDFKVNNRSSFVVLPKKAATGNVWVWRARFPGWHTEMDELLLKKGFHVAYTDVTNLYGSSKAVAQWDAFYKEMTEKYGLAQKVAIECVSRGGLITYNWAKVNTDKVACIYAEAPVCDIKSWPGGKGSGKGSPGDWKKAQAVYGMTEAELMEWQGNPVDGLEKLAKARVPVLHIVCLEDKIVPADENSLKLFENYVKYGGIMTVSPNLKGPFKLNGHHFPIEHVEDHAEFIIRHTLKHFQEKQYFTVRDDLKNTLIKIKKNKKLRVAYLGGSITCNPGWRPMLCDYFEKKFPDTEFDFVHAGIPSFGSTPHSFRFEKDVWLKGPVDLLFVEAAVNDSSNGRTPKEMIRGMEGVMRHARNLNPEIDVIFMHFVDPAKMADYNKGKVPEVVMAHEKVAEHYKINSLNLALEVTERINAGEFTWQGDFKNLHPSPFGQKIYYRSMSKMLDHFFGIHLDPDDKVAAKTLPKALDEYSYEAGKIINISEGKSNWKLHSKWRPDKGGTRAGFVNVPALEGTIDSGNLSLEFEGKGIGIWVAAGYDAGIIEFRVDGGDWRKQDLFTRWSRGLHLPWVYMLAPELKLGNHKLEIRVIGEKNPQSKGSVCRIFRFVVNK